VCRTVLVVEGVGCVEMDVGIGLPTGFCVVCGVARCMGGVALANTVGIVVSVTANVGVGVGVGVCLPGGVLVGFTKDEGAEISCGAFACAFAIPSTALMQQKRRSKRAHAAIRARATVDLATCERAAPLMT
jgi:hypothetical protein